MSKQIFKPYNPIIQICDCGKIDVDEGHSCGVDEFMAEYWRDKQEGTTTMGEMAEYENERLRGDMTMAGLPIKGRGTMAKKQTQAKTETVINQVPPQSTDLAVVEAGFTPALMLEKAIMTGAGVEVMEKLLALQERWEANQARKAFDSALADIRADLPDIVKSRAVNMGAGRPSYRYEDLSDMIDVLSPAMSAHGLSFRWKTESTSAEAVTVTCILSHRDGHSESTSLTANHDHSGAKNPIQAIGSVVTYLQRYTLKAAFGIAASVDDDAQSANAQPQASGAGKVYEITAAHKELKTLLADYIDANCDPAKHEFDYYYEEILCRLSTWPNHPGVKSLDRFSPKMVANAIEETKKKMAASVKKK